MKFIASSATLMKQLNPVNGVINPNPVIPILEYFLFDSDDKHLIVTGTNLEISVRSTLEVESQKPGKVAVPARLILDILKSLPEQPIVFEVVNDDYAIEITSESGKYKIAGEDPEEFPKFPTVDDATAFTIPSNVFLRAINTAAFAAGADEQRPALTGIQFRMEQGAVEMAATDGNKLVVYRNTGIDISNDDSFIMPRKGIDILKSTLGDNSDDLQIEYSSTNVLFRYRHIDIICRLIDEKYPDYHSVIPNDPPFQMTIDRTSLMNALKRASIFTNKSTYEVRLGIDGNEITINAKDIDFANEAVEKLTCEYEGDPIEIAFNARFLVEMATTIQTDDLVVNLTAPNKPAIIQPSYTMDDEDITMLVMPIIYS